MQQPSRNILCSCHCPFRNFLPRSRVLLVSWWTKCGQSQLQTWTIVSLKALSKYNGDLIVTLKEGLQSNALFLNRFIYLIFSQFPCIVYKQVKTTRRTLSKPIRRMMMPKYPKFDDTPTESFESRPRTSITYIRY